MSSFVKVLPAWMVVVATMAGCAHHTACRHCEQSTAYVEYGLPEVERSTIVGEIDPELLTVSAELQSTVSHDYRALSAVECQCLAVEASLLGKLLDGERATCRLDDLGRNERRARCMQLAVLHFAAAEARNKSAADALKLYYGLAEVESGLDAVEAALTEIDDVQAKIGQVKRQDLTVPFDASQFDRQRLTLVAKRADLEATRAALNAKLRMLLGFDAPPEAPLLWPDEPLRLTDMALDAESEVAYGLMIKPELAALHRLATADEQDTAAAAKALLGDVHGLMGVAARSMVREMLNTMLGITGPEACVRRAQIRSLYEGRAKQLAADVRAAVEGVEARRRQAVAAQRLVESRFKRIDELTQRHETAQASFVEIGEARLKLIDERQAVTSAVIAWKRAIVELRELQGALVAECRGGYCPTTAEAAEEPVPVPIEPLPPVEP